MNAMMGRLVQEINAKEGQMVETLAVGNVKDFGQYREIVGSIKALRAVRGFCDEITASYERANGSEEWDS